jgi:hypothetical protein
MYWHICKLQAESAFSQPCSTRTIQHHQPTEAHISSDPSKPKQPSRTCISSAGYSCSALLRINIKLLFCKHHRLSYASLPWTLQSFLPTEWFLLNLCLIRISCSPDMSYWDDIKMSCELQSKVLVSQTILHLWNRVTYWLQEQQNNIILYNLFWYEKKST